MALVVFENNANATLNDAINSSVTSITLGLNQGLNFPDLNAGEVFYITLQNYTAQLVEICRVTAKSGDVLTVVRGVDGTNALSWSVQDTAIQLRLTKETLDRFVQVSEIAPTPGQLLTIDSQGQLIEYPGVTYESFTASEGQSAFTTAASLPVTATNIETYVNGVRQYPPANFTRTGSNQLTFTEGLAVGDSVVIGV